MQLFITALQMLCDEHDTLGEGRVKSQLALSLMERNYEPGHYQFPAPKSDKESSVPGPAGPVDYHARVQLRQHASRVLGLLTAARMYTPNQHGFNNMVLVELWARNMTSRHSVKTPLGELPAWIFGKLHPDDCVFGLYCREDEDEDGSGVPLGMQSRSMDHIKEILGRKHRMIELFLEGKYGLYTPAGRANKRDRSWSTWLQDKGRNQRSIMREMVELERYAQAGSAVAERMLYSCKLWLMGKDTLLQGRHAEAIRLFAESIGSSFADGDPFSGWWAQNPSQPGLSPMYSRALEAVLTQDPTSIDARVVQGRMYLEMGNAPAGERVLTSAITAAPRGMRPVALRALIRGNVANWAGALADSRLCVELDPMASIHHYWCAVAMRNMPDSFSYEQFAAEIQLFIASAAPEGRKVCQAWFDLALLIGIRKELASRAGTRRLRGRGLQVDASFSVDDVDLMMGYAKEGFKADKRMLPLLRVREQRSPSQGRQLCKAMLGIEDVSHLHEAMGETQIALRERANAAFRSGRYQDAVDEYSRLLDMPQDVPPGMPTLTERHVILSNRSAALAKLGEYAAAERDALECVQLEPSWVKGYARLARAKLSRLDGAGALAAISWP